MNEVDRILHGGRAPKRSDGYVHFEQRPQMGFEVERKTGASDAFYYHNIDNLDIRVIKGHEHLVFTHRQKVVVAQGKNLKAILRGLIAHSVSSFRDFCEGDPKEDEAKIDFIQIASLENRALDDMVAV